MWQSYDSIWLHFIWSTKQRDPLIKGNFKYQLYNKLREIASKQNFHVDYLNGTEDHIHSLVSVDTTFRIFDVPKILKGASSYYVNDKKLIQEYFEWQDGYAVFSVSPSDVHKVRFYIKNQEAHHKNFTLQEE